LVGSVEILIISSVSEVNSVWNGFKWLRIELVSLFTLKHLTNCISLSNYNLSSLSLFHSFLLIISCLLTSLALRLMAKMNGFRRLYNLTVPYSPILPSEPMGPILTGSFPGPRTQKLLETTKAFSQDFRTVLSTQVKLFVDFAKSVGNYAVDADGNYFLDTYCHIAALPVGYNHPDMKLVAAI
jgi:hypothetical protein